MRKFLSAFAMAALLAPAAAAHTQDAAHAHGFLDGALHPLTGLDHALAMVAVGVLAFALGRRAAWMLPLAFVMGMGAGVFTTFGAELAPLIEIGIVTSVIGVGALLAFEARGPLWLVMTCVALAGAAHGAAHSIEGATSQFSAFAVGALAMTVLLHLAGVGVGFSLRQAPRLSHRLLGAGVIVTGSLMAAGV